MNPIIEVNGISKSFGDLKAVDNLSMEVREGELFAFLGPNGAGKSTTIDMLCTYLEPDSGTVKVAGHELGKENDQIRSLIGIVHQKSLLDDLLTVRDNLKIRAGISMILSRDIPAAIERVQKITDIKDFLDRPYGKLSGGQRRRVDIARGLLIQPKILFLDEPTTGLDPQSRNSVWKFIRDLQKETGITVFLTTHYLEEANEADYLVIIDHGKIVAKGTPQQIRGQHVRHRLLIDSKAVDSITKYLAEQQLSYQVHGNNLSVKINDTKQALPILERFAAEIDSFEVIKGTLDDAFLEITGEELRD